MKTLRVLLPLLVIFAAAASAADPGLLNLVAPDAKAVAGLSVNQAKVSPFGQYILAHMQPDSPDFQKFTAETGFDPCRDLTEIVISSNASANIMEHWLVVGRGIFNPARIESSVRASGGSVTSFQAVDLISPPASPEAQTQTVFAFPDPSTAVMGDVDSVKATIGRFQSKATNPALAARVKDVSVAYDFWFVALVPLSEFAGVAPDPNMNQALQSNLFQSIQQASGGVKFGANVLLGMQAVARSDKDATALADVIRFLAGMIQTNRDKSPSAGQVATLADNLNITTAGNTTTVSLSVPEIQLENMLNQARTQKGDKASIHPRGSGASAAK